MKAPLMWSSVVGRNRGENIVSLLDLNMNGGIWGPEGWICDAHFLSTNTQRAVGR